MPTDPNLPGNADAGAPEPELAPLPSVNVFSQTVERVTFISSTEASLLAGLGRLEGDENGLLLFPFVEMKYETADPDTQAVTPVFMATMTMDNAAYLLADVCGDFQQVLKQFAMIAEGGIGPEPIRMQYAKRFLSNAHRSLGQCLTEIDKLVPN